MERIYFKNEQEGGTPIPKVMWWYCIEKKYKRPLNADFANELLNNDLKKFFKKYTEELKKPCLFKGIFSSETNITKEDIEFYKKELGGLI